MDLTKLFFLLNFGMIISTSGRKITGVYFGKTYTGVAFTPYVKNFEIHEDGARTLPPYNSYNVTEIKIMLRTISTKFNSIITTGMGVHEHNLNNTWDDVDANCHVAKSAAEINDENGCLTITVAQGVSPDGIAEVEYQELQNAFTAAKLSNDIFPGTVWSLVFVYKNLTIEKGVKLLEILKKNKDRANRFGLKIGVKLDNCKDVNKSLGLERKILLKIAREVDYIVCVKLNTKTKLVKQGPKIVAQAIFKKFEEYIQIFKSENPNVGLILLTGWPSSRNGFDGPQEVYTIQNLRDYWVQIAEWSNKNHIRSYLFEAFDEPWRTVHDDRKSNQIHGSLGHYGWWRRNDNDDIYSIVEKLAVAGVTENNPTWPFVVLTVTLCSISIILILAVIGITVVFRLRLKQKNVLTAKEMHEFFNGGASNINPSLNRIECLPYDESWEIQQEELTIDQTSTLGSGAFGVVVKGIYRGELVAVKTVKEGAGKEYIIALLSELKVMIYLGAQENIVALIGANTKYLQRGLLHLVVEMCSEGNLSGYLMKNRAKFLRPSILLDDTHANGPEDFSSAQLLRWAYQICSAMDFLESKQVIHVDLAARNVLLTENLRAKVGDFGLSRKLYQFTSYVKKHQEPLPWRWMSIESLQRMEFSHKSDVWSFGVTLWEIYSLGDIPYQGMSYRTDFATKLSNGLRLHCPELSPVNVFMIMTKCWHRTPEERPNFSAIKALIIDAMNTMNTKTSNSEDYTSLQWSDKAEDDSHVCASEHSRRN